MQGRELTFQLITELDKDVYRHREPRGHISVRPDPLVDGARIRRQLCRGCHFRAEVEWDNTEEHPMGMRLGGIGEGLGE